MRVGTGKTTAAYLFLLVICALAFWGTNSPASLWALGLVMVLGFLCALDSAITAQFSTLTFELARTHDEKSPLEFVARLSTPWFVSPSRIEVDVTINNRLFDTETHSTLVLRSAGCKPQTFTYSYPEFACGKVDVRVDRVLFFDVFGFTQMIRQIPFHASQLVYPRAVSMKVAFERSPQSAYSGVTFDLFKRGVDRSETLELRPYHDGDDPREVHWKLSAKMGELFVREPSRPTDYNVVMLFGLGRDYAVPVDPAFDPSAVQAEQGEGAQGRSSRDRLATVQQSVRSFLGRTDASASSAAGERVAGSASAIGSRTAYQQVDVETLDAAIALFASLSTEMVAGGVGHAVALIDGQGLRLQNVDSQNGWGIMLDTLLSLPLPQFASHSIDLYAVDPACAAYTKIVYVTTEIDEGELQRLSDKADVTVFLVGDVSLSQGESLANCDIISIAPNQLEGRVETLSV